MGIIDYFSKDEKAQKESGMSEEFSFTVDSSVHNGEIVERDGVVETAELAEGPKVHETEEGEEVVELGKFEGEDTEAVTIPHNGVMKVSREDLERHSAFFHPVELEELMKKEHHFSEEELSAVDKVEKALDDPSMPNTRRELWDHLCREENRGIYADYEEGELSEAEVDRKAVEAFEKEGMSVDYEHPDNKTVSEMTGSELKEVMGEAVNPEPETEELSQSEEPEEEESGEEIETVSEELAQTASAAFDHYAQESGKGYWSDIAEELSAESRIPDTRIESTTQEGVKKITTSLPELREELMRLHERDDARTKVLDIEGDTIVAHAFEGDIENGI